MTDIRTLHVDWDSVNSIEKKIRSLTARKHEIKSGGNGPISLVTKGEKLSLYLKIWSTDISSIYGDIKTSDKSKSFYVYAHLNPLEPVDMTRARDVFAATMGMQYLPFYIGKGCGGRDGNTIRNETHRKVLQKLKSLELSPIVIRVKDGITELDALQYESKLIDIFSLIVNGGLLCNLDEGYKRIERRKMYRDCLRKLCRTAGDYDRVKKELY
jgi:hypothetical protein